MKLTFKTIQKEGRSIASLIKKIDQISCQIRFDLENNIVEVHKVKETAVDEVVDLIEDFYTIRFMEIDNLDMIETVPEVVPEDTGKTESITEVKELPDKAEANDAEESDTATVKDDVDDKIEQFTDSEIDSSRIREQLNKFVNSAYLAMNKGAFSSDVEKYINTAKTEMLMRFQNRETVKFSIGDVVKCFYGYHLPGEINGAHVHAIVCDVIDDMVYVVPITKATGNSITSLSYIEFKAPDDVTYNSDYYTGGTALLDKGRYIHINRVNEVVGRVEKFFFKEVTHLLTRALNFTDNVSAYNSKDSEEYDEVDLDETEDVEPSEMQSAEPEEEAESEDEAEVAESEVEAETAEPEAEKEVTKPEAVKAPKKRKINKSPKPGSGEAGVYEFFGDAILNLDSKKAAHKQAIPFMKALGMDPKDKMLVEAFTTAPYVDAITYENIADRICETVGHTKSIVVFHMKMTFQKWLKSYPELKEKYPRISFVSFLKVFAREVS